MKTNFFRLILPIMVMMLAVFAAVANNNAKTEVAKSTDVFGYVHTSNPEECQESQECSTIGSTMCTVNNLGITQIWDKDEDGQCIVALKRKLP